MTFTAYKHIAVNDSGVPVIEGTGFKVTRLVAEHQTHGLSPEELQFQHPQLTLAQVYSALAFYEDHRELVDAQLREGEARAEVLKEQLDSPELKVLVRRRSER